MFNLIVKLTILFNILVLTLTAVDDSLTERARGIDVVKVVVNKIRQSQIFPPDYNFLQRVAYVETKFGTNTDTFRLNFYGGIWAVPNSLFGITKDTVNNPILLDAYNKILVQLQISWQTVQWTDLLKPLYSGLAASLYFLAISPVVAIPQKIVDQARYWALYYNANVVSRNEATYTLLVAEMQNSVKFNCKMDLIVVLDESGSIGQDNYTLALNAVSSLFKFYSLETVREGFMTFSTNNKLIFPLDNSFTSLELSAIISQVVYGAGGTNTNAAIAMAIDMFQKATPRANGIPKIMVLFTDGKSTDNQNVANSQLAKAAGITSIAVGIADYNPTELNLIANSDKRHLVTLKQFDTLIEIVAELSTSICEVPQTPLLNTFINDGLEKGENRVYSFQLPQSQDGITVYLNSSTGKVRGFYSYDYQTPSAALNDGVLMGESSVIPMPSGGGVMGQGSEQKVYVSVVGVDEINDYTIRAVEGQHLPPYVCFPSIQWIQEDFNLIRLDIDLIRESLALIMQQLQNSAVSNG